MSFVVFGKFSISTQELQRADQDLVALAIGTSFLVNELNFNTKLLAGTMSHIPEENVAKQFRAVQQNIIFRNLTLSLVEYAKAFEASRKTVKRRKLNDSHPLKRLVKSFESRFASVKDDSACKIAERIRNKHAGHIDLNDIKSSLQRMSDNNTHSGFAHSMQGNSYYLFAEEIAFLASFSHSGQGPTLSHREAINRIEVWKDWLLKASRFAMEFHSSTLVTTLLDEIGNKQLSKDFVAVEEELWSDLAEFSIPLYSKREI